MKRVIRAATENDVYYWNGVDEVPQDVTHVVIEDGVTEIKRRLFFDCTKLKFVEIPESVIKIGEHAFHGCASLVRMIIPNSVNLIADNAFAFCYNLTSINLPMIRSISNGMFCCCSSLRSIEIPRSVAIIGDLAFYNCSKLNNVTIPNSVKVIGAHAFSGCSNLISVTIPDSVRLIGKRAFSECSNLENLLMPSDVEKISKDVFVGTKFENVYEILKSKSKTSSWRSIQNKLRHDLEIYYDPIYEQTEVGIFIDKICREVEESLSVWLEPSVQAGQGVINVYASEDDHCVAENIDYRSFNQSVVELIASCNSKKEFKSEYKDFLTSEIESHPCEDAYDET